MKFLVISDTHGRHDYLKKVLAEKNQYDRILHLGDVEGGEAEIEKMSACPVDFVKGNMDGLAELAEEKLIYAETHKIWMIHGHTEGISAGMEKLVRDAKERDADIVLFGHTHHPLLTKREGLTILNPGSISFPRPLGKNPSYGIIETNGSSGMKAEIRYVTG